MSTWLEHGVFKYLVQHYCSYLKGCFWRRMSICTSGWSKADCPPQHGWASSSTLEAQVEQNGSIGGNALSVSKLRHWFPAFRLQLTPSILQLLRPSHLNDCGKRWLLPGRVLRPPSQNPKLASTGLGNVMGTWKMSFLSP